MQNNRKLLWLLFTVFIVGWIVWGNHHLTLSRDTISSERLPSAFDGFKIAHISDLHNASFGHNNSRLLSVLAQTQPDIIVITGDMWDFRSFDAKVGLHFAQQAAKIAPTYFVTGNHESLITQYDVLAASLVDAGVNLLDNRTVTLSREGQNLVLAGLSDYHFYPDESSTPKLLLTSAVLQSLITTDDYTILLAHQPEHFNDYTQSGADLIFAGHAHGGQIRIPWIGGLFAPGQGSFPQYDAGIYTMDMSTMVVSRGLGNSQFPVRINNPPEIVMVELHTKK